MRKKMTTAELHALALKQGAEVSVGGRRFNSDRSEMNVKAPPPRPLAAVTSIRPAAAAPTPPSAPITAAAAAPASVDAVSRTELERLLLEQEMRFTKQLTMLVDAMRRDDDDEDERPAAFKPTYDADGQITLVEVQYQALQ